MIDLQVNGLKLEACNCNFWNAPSKTDIQSLVELQKEKGIEKFLATLITDSPEQVSKNLDSVNTFFQEDSSCLFGVHMEGGFISKAGVHPKEYLSSINYKVAQELIKKFPGLIKLWTLCPRLDKNGDLTKLLQDNDIQVSYGHSNASYQEAMKAFNDYGVRLVTHWGNAMFVYEDFKQRNSEDKDFALLESFDEAKAGLGLAAYHHSDVVCMVIAGAKESHDQHIDPQLLKRLADKKRGKLILVSDSVHYEGPLPPEHLVGGLRTLKEHSENALKAGLSKDELKSATKDLINKIFDL